MRVESADSRGGFPSAEATSAADGATPRLVADAPDDALAGDLAHEKISSPRGLVLGLVLSAAVWGAIAVLIF
jgi:hypothetical protein